MLKHIPNLITLLRIVLAPVFVITYFYVSRTVGIVVLAAIMFSDLADGYIARRFHVQSKVGELLDPFADKLAQVVICIVLFLDNIAPLWFMVVLIVKEMLMLILGYIFLKKDEEISSAKWYGKAATACFYIVICANLVVSGFMASHRTLQTCGYVFAVLCAYFAFFNYGINHLIERSAKKKLKRSAHDNAGKTIGE